MPLRPPRGLERHASDSGSPLNARWRSEEECNDPFAQDVARSVAGLLRDAGSVEWPNPPRHQIRGVLVGHGNAPSAVWHASAVGALLEVGFSPAADCVRRHVEVLDECLRPENVHDPATQEPHADWVLRTRHAAWVLACLAELPSSELESELEDSQDAAQLHKRVLDTSYRYLTGEATDSSDPTSWIARPPGWDAWPEYWGQRQPNLVNSLYVLLGICRAERHGFGAQALRSSGFELVGRDVPRLLIQNLKLKSTSRGLVITLDGPWVEEWAREPLPPGVVALLALVLVEYSHFLYEKGETVNSRREALRAQLIAQRLGHHLCVTPSRWWNHAELLLNIGAEGYWSLPSYSLGVRAILESGSTDAFNNVVAAAFETIDDAHVDTNSGAWVAWADPTRGFESQVSVRDRERGHRTIKLPAAGARTAIANPAGIHAATMAYSALRRALARSDPRLVLHKTVSRRLRGTATSPKPHYAPTPFTAIELQRAGRRWRAHLMFPESDPLYVEEVSLNISHGSVLQVLADSAVPLTRAEIATKLAADDTYVWSRSLDVDAVENAIEEINQRCSVSLVAGDRQKTTRYRLGATLRITPDE